MRRVSTRFSRDDQAEHAGHEVETLDTRHDAQTGTERRVHRVTPEQPVIGSAGYVYRVGAHPYWVSEQNLRPLAEPSLCGARHATSWC